MPESLFWRELQAIIKQKFVDAMHGDEELALVVMREYIKFVFNDESIHKEIDTLSEEEVVRAATKLTTDHPELLPEVLTFAKETYESLLQSKTDTHEEQSDT